MQDMKLYLPGDEEPEAEVPSDGKDDNEGNIDTEILQKTAELLARETIHEMEKYLLPRSNATDSFVVQSTAISQAMAAIQRAGTSLEKSILEYVKTLIRTHDSTLKGAAAYDPLSVDPGNLLTDCSIRTEILHAQEWTHLRALLVLRQIEQSEVVGLGLPSVLREPKEFITYIKAAVISVFGIKDNHVKCVDICGTIGAAILAAIKGGEPATQLQIVTGEDEG